MLDVLALVVGWPAALAILVSAAGALLWWLARRYEDQWRYETHRFCLGAGRILVGLGLVALAVVVGVSLLTPHQYGSQPPAFLRQGG